MGGSTRLAIAVSHSSNTVKGNALIATVSVTLHAIAQSLIDANQPAGMLLSSAPMAEALRGQHTCSKAMEAIAFTR